MRRRTIKVTKVTIDIPDVNVAELQAIVNERRERNARFNRSDLLREWIEIQIGKWRAARLPPLEPPPVGNLPD